MIVFLNMIRPVFGERPLRPEIPQLELTFLERLRHVLMQEGWAAEPESLESGVDLVAHRGSRVCLIVLKTAHDARRSSLQAYLADAVLRSRAAARRVGNHASGLGIVAAPAISEAIAESLRHYARDVELGDGYGWLDLEGRMEIFGDGLRIERSSRERRRSTVPAGRSSEVFTDLNQWVIKVLLAPWLPADVLAGSREPARTVSQLAKIAHVSVPSAHRLVRVLESEGFLEPRSDLRLTRVVDLMQRWRMATRSALREVNARWIFPPADPQAELARRAAANSEQLWPRNVTQDRGGFVAENRVWERGPRACLALFSACDALGYGIVQGVPRAMYVERLDASLIKKMGLVPSLAGEPVDVVLRQPRFPEAVFRGMVVRDGVPIADALQCWLDLADHPSRGAEQADYLWNRIISRAIDRGAANAER